MNFLPRLGPGGQRTDAQTVVFRLLGVVLTLFFAGGLNLGGNFLALSWVSFYPSNQAHLADTYIPHRDRAVERFQVSLQVCFRFQGSEIAILPEFAHFRPFPSQSVASWSSFANRRWRVIRLDPAELVGDRVIF